MKRALFSPFDLPRNVFVEKYGRRRPYSGHMKGSFPFLGKCHEPLFWTMKVICLKMKMMYTKTTMTNMISGNKKGALYLLMKFLNGLNGVESCVCTQLTVDPQFFSFRTRELPGTYPFVVQQSYINECVGKWREPAQFLCKSMYNTLSVHLKQIIHKHFAHFGHGMLEHRIWYIFSRWIPSVLIAIHSVLMQDHLKFCFARTKQKINWLVDLEDTPFSLNTHYLYDYKSKFLTFYRGIRNKGNYKDIMVQIDAYIPSSSSHNNHKNASSSYGISKVMSGLAEIGLIGVQARDLAKLFKIDDMEPALEIMADVRAYFQGTSSNCDIP